MLLRHEDDCEFRVVRYGVAMASGSQIFGFSALRVRSIYNLGWSCREADGIHLTGCQQCMEEMAFMFLPYKKLTQYVGQSLELLAGCWVIFCRLYATR